MINISKQQRKHEGSMTNDDHIQREAKPNLYPTFKSNKKNTNVESTLFAVS